MDKDQIRAQDLAHALALTELVRFAIGEIAFDPNREVFRQKLSRVEAAVIDGITHGKHYSEDQTDAATENYIKETASSYVTLLLTSIRHPDDPKTAPPQ